MSQGWESFLKEQFPAYLLPHAAQSAIDLVSARAFLRQFVRKGDALRLISAASLFVGRASALRDFARRLLPDLIRQLPAMSVVEPRIWEGGFHGALDIPRTQALHLAGQSTRFVTRQRRRTFALPENLLVASVARRLRTNLSTLIQEGANPDRETWGAPAADALGSLRHLLTRTRLGEIPDEPVTSEHLRAAHSACHPAYAAAITWHRDLDQIVENPIPEVLARQLAEGALLPIRPPKQFEIAVLLRLLQSIEAELQAAEPDAWELRRAIVLQGRHGPIATLARVDHSAAIELFYDQAPDKAGPRDRALRHYLHHSGRLRPDALFVLHRQGQKPRAAVIEVKCSVRPQTLMAGLTEAVVYQQELAEDFPGGVLAVAVGAGGVPGEPGSGDTLILTDWEKLGGLGLAGRLGALPAI